MRLKCLHGFFVIEEEFPHDVSDFMTMTGLSLVPRGTYYTFEALSEAPDYSLKGKPVLGVPAIKTFAGEPWEVFRENGLVYDFVHGLVVLAESIMVTAEVLDAGNYYWANGLIVPGSISEGGRILGYDAHYSFDRARWIYTEVTYG